MSRTVYVASGLENWMPVLAFQDMLRKAGWTVPLDWSGIWKARLDAAYDGLEAPGSIDDLQSHQIKTAANVDAFVLLTPGGRGAHIEYGAALGSGKARTVVIAHPDLKRSDFYRLSVVVRNFTEAMEVLR